MVSRKLIISNPAGLDIEQAGIVCREAVKFKSLITFAYEDSTANAKSILSVLGSCVRGGDEIELFCDGVDEELALQTMCEVLRGRPEN